MYALPYPYPRRGLQYPFVMTKARWFLGLTIDNPTLGEVEPSFAQHHMTMHGICTAPSVGS